MCFEKELRLRTRHTQSILLSPLTHLWLVRLNFVFMLAVLCVNRLRLHAFFCCIGVEGWTHINNLGCLSLISLWLLFVVVVEIFKFRCIVSLLPMYYRLVFRFWVYYVMFYPFRWPSLSLFSPSPLPSSLSSSKLLLFSFVFQIWLSTERSASSFINLSIY